MDATVVIPDLKPAEETRPTIDFSELQAALYAEVQEAEKSLETSFTVQKHIHKPRCYPNYKKFGKHEPHDLHDYPEQVGIKIIQYQHLPDTKSCAR